MKLISLVVVLTAVFAISQPPVVPEARAQDTQDREIQADDAARTHIKLYKKTAPSVVAVRQTGTGSGVIIDARGYILTTTEAIRGRRSATVYLMGGRTESASVVVRVEDLQLAILKLGGDRTDYPALALGRSRDARLGKVCYVLGDSFGSITSGGQPAISVGIVSGRYKLKKKRRQPYDGEVIETSAAVNQNQWGAPLLDAEGRVIGLVTRNYHDARFAGVAIPIDVLKDEIEKALKGSPVVKAARTKSAGWIGATFKDDAGVVVVDTIDRSGPARKAGLRRDDEIIKVTAAGRSKTVKKLEDLETRLAKLEPGQTLTLRVYRESADRELDLTITAEEKPFY